jgi:hypothetical protein
MCRVQVAVETVSEFHTVLSLCHFRSDPTAAMVVLPQPSAGMVAVAFVSKRLQSVSTAKFWRVVQTPGTMRAGVQGLVVPQVRFGPPMPFRAVLGLDSSLCAYSGF